MCGSHWVHGGSPTSSPEPHFQLDLRLALFLSCIPLFLSKCSRAELETPGCPFFPPHLLYPWYGQGVGLCRGGLFLQGLVSVRATWRLMPIGSPPPSSSREKKTVSHREHVTQDSANHGITFQYPWELVERVTHDPGTANDWQGALLGLGVGVGKDGGSFLWASVCSSCPF